jgi:hypothetical protein
MGSILSLQPNTLVQRDDTVSSLSVPPTKHMLLSAPVVLEPAGRERGRRRDGRAQHSTRAMEASSNRSRSGSATLKCHRGVGAGSGSTAQSLSDDILRSIFSRLDDHFDLARCSAVCSPWSPLFLFNPSPLFYAVFFQFCF